MPKTYFHNNWYKATENVPLEFTCIRTIFRLKKEKRKEKKRIFFKLGQAVTMHIRPLTLSPSNVLVSMTILLVSFCQITFQKSSNVLGLKGPVKYQLIIRNHIKDYIKDNTLLICRWAARMLFVCKYICQKDSRFD